MSPGEHIKPIGLNEGVGVGLWSADHGVKACVGAPWRGRVDMERRVDGRRRRERRRKGKGKGEGDEKEKRRRIGCSLLLWSQWMMLLFYLVGRTGEKLGRD
jgi:hypothetical protein